MSRSSQSLRLLHVFGREARGELLGEILERLAAIATSSRHEVAGVSELPDGPRPRQTQLIRQFPKLSGFPWPGRLHKLATAMREYDLVCTYDAATLDACMAHTVFRDAMSLPPLIHHESGRQSGKSQRDFYRRFALGKASGLVVPTEEMEERALVTWQQPIGRVKHISPAVRLSEFSAKPRPDILPGLIKRDKERWAGFDLADTAVAEMHSMVDACGRLPEGWNLIGIGEGENARELRDASDRLALNNRVHVVGSGHRDRILPLLDLFVTTGGQTASPTRAAKAMASGLPLAIGERWPHLSLLSDDNRAVLNDGTALRNLGEQMARLAGDDALRGSIGTANRSLAAQAYDWDGAVATYRRLYSSAMRADAL